MFKKNSSVRSLHWLTRFLTALAFVLLAGFSFTFVTLWSALSTQENQGQFHEFDSPHNIAQLQREVLRLQNIISVDDALAPPPDAVSLQQDLVESRLNRLEDDGLRRYFDDASKENLIQIRKDWNALQPNLLMWQADPQNETVRLTLLEALSALELIVNDSLRTQSIFLAERRTQLEAQLSAQSVRVGINNLLGVGALASALGLYVIIQQQKRKVTDQLQVREQRLRTIVKTIPDMILRVDHTGTIVDYEPNEQTDLGIPGFHPADESVIGKTIDEFTRPQLAQEFHQRLQAAFTTGRFVRHEFWVDRDNNGALAWFQASATPINETEAIVAIRDVTEDKQHRVAVQKAQRMESLGMMAGGVAHDFGNSLTNIRMNASMLKRRLAGQEDVQKYVIAVSDAAEEAYKLTHQLLAYAGKSELEAKKINLNHFLNEHDAIIRATVTKRRLYAVVQTEGIPLINADAWQLQQMLMNLVINAKDATESGSGCITMRTGTAELSDDNRPTLIGGVKIADGKYVTLEVQDNGRGISTYMYERIFEPYFSTDKENHSGLGLSATLGIMRSHSGGIELKSARSEGTTFRLYFPAHQKKRRKNRKPLFPE